MKEQITAAARDDGFNPFDGITPSFGPFEEVLASRVYSLLALAWIIALAYLGYRLVVTLSTLAKAKKGRYGADLDEAKTDLAWVGGAIVAVAAAGPLFGALVVF